MSDAIFSQFAAGMATLNTTLQQLFERDTTRCFLLKREPKSSGYEELAELVGGYLVEYGQLRDDLFLAYVTLDEDFTDIWSQATHIGYGVPDNSNQVFVYEIQPDQKERVTPDFSSHEWKCFAVRVPKERY